MKANMKVSVEEISNWDYNTFKENFKEIVPNLSIRYIRNKNNRIAVLLSLISEDKMYIGFSLCNRQDKWDFVKGKHMRNYGIFLALHRAISGFNKKSCAVMKRGDDTDVMYIPQSVSHNLIIFIDKVRDRFVNNEMPVWCRKEW